MATASFYDDSVSCRLCHETYTDPRTLFCGHTFCAACLQQHISATASSNIISCPLCRQESKVPKSGEFPVNRALIDAINVLRISAEHLRKNSLKGAVRDLGSACGHFKHDIESEIEKLKTDIDISAAEVEREIDRRAQGEIRIFTRSVNAERERKKKELQVHSSNCKDEIPLLFSDHKTLLETAHRHLEQGENLIKSNSNSDIDKNIYQIQEICKKIQTNLKIENQNLKITPSDLKQKKDKTFHVDLGEIVIPKIKSLTDTQTDRRTDRQTDIVTQTHRRTDKLTLSKTIDTRKSTGLLFRLFNREPDIRSIVVLGGDTSSKIVVSDYNNCSVKCFCSHTARVLCEYKPNTEPLGLAKSRGQQVVVALPRESQILYLDVQDNIRQVKTLRTKKKYLFISVLPGNRLAANAAWYGNYLDILDEQGGVVQTLPSVLIPDPRRLTVKGECVIVVTCVCNCLACVTSSGQITWQSRDSARLTGLRGVACDREDFLYVCSWDRECIVQLTRDGHVIRDVITPRDGLSEPRSICCDDDNIYVTQDNGEIKIFTWSKSEQ